MHMDAARDAIRRGPQGPAVGAFFDFAGTLVHGFRPRRRSGLLLNGIQAEKSKAGYDAWLAAALLEWRGHPEAGLMAQGERLFERTIAGHLYPEAWQLVRAHEAAGHTLVVASSIFECQVRPAAAALGIPNVLCTPLDARNGRLTGELAGPALWRDGKAAAVRAFAQRNDVDLASSYGYSNGGEDVEFLAAVGRPTVVNPDTVLAERADRKWPVLRFAARDDRHPVRTAAAYGGFAAAVLGGLAGGALRRRDRRATVDRILSRAGDFTLGGAGVQVRVTGTDHTRPAVFIFNHQSELDPFVIAKVLRGGFTGITKKEIADNPWFGPVARFAGAVFIDRADSEKARQALSPVVDTLRNGTSVIIAPEGTRSLTPSVGPFKKGAFHIAMQAGVPIVPIVIRNAGELFWKHAKTVRPGVIDVAVLDPIDVSTWRAADLPTHIDEVRATYQRLLRDWPR